MPKTSLQKLRESIETASELTPEHRAELLRVAGDLETQVRPLAESGADADHDELRQAIDLTGRLVERKRTGEDDDLLTEFETAVERIAIKHPVVANFLSALGRLV